MNTSIVQITNLSKIYKTGEDIETAALSNISLAIRKGEFVVVMGPSGSGKSTLMHIIGALDLPTKGKYFLDGQNVGTMSEDELSEIRNKKIGFIFQAYNLLPRISAIDNVMLPMSYAGVSEQEQVGKATKFLNLVGLGDRMHHSSSQLSGGQQQRVAIARSLVMDPAILLADEPTGNLASAQANEIMGIFQHLNEKGHTIVMITHEMDIANYARRIIHIKDGKIVDDKINSKQIKLKKRL